MSKDSTNLQEQDPRPDSKKIISWGRHGNTALGGDDSGKGVNDGSKGVAGRADNAAKQSKGPRISHTLELSLLSIFMLAFTPTLSTFFVYACEHYQCSLTPGLADLWQSSGELFARLQGVGTTEALVEVYMWITVLPRKWFSWEALTIYTIWYFVQAIMYAIVPGKIGYGQKTLAGRELPYKVNGLNCYLLTHAAFVAAVYFKVIPVSIIVDNWTGLFVATNIYGYALTLFAFVKAHTFPCHPEDRKFSGSVWYDMFMGIEFNPRIGELWDFKLFHNGRPGIIAWTLIDISFLFSSKAHPGEVFIPSIPAILLLALHALYVVDFFYHEDWYLRTIDIAHDHFGFYLAWGDCVWLPFMYTLQAQYLGRNSENLGGEHIILNIITFLLGAGGYIIFRGSNNQKDILRRYYSYLTKSTVDPKTGKVTPAKPPQSQKEELKVWGKKPTYILAPYQTSDGSWHTAVLLTCGFWGIARHLNYLGDLMMAAAMSLATVAVTGPGSQGGGWMIGWWYSVYLTILLVHRTRRCNDRCLAKYGEKWNEYRKAVRWVILPGVY